MQRSKYFLGISMLVLLAGCGDESLSERVGSSITGSAVDFASGLGKGVDEKMLVTLESEPSLSTYGLTATVGKGREMASNRAAIYVVTTQPFKGQVLAKALDKSGNEIGRASSEVDLKQDDAVYVDLQFPSQMDSNLVRKYRISARGPQG